MKEISEFTKAFKALSKCDGSIACGCILSPMEALDSEFLYRLCQKYCSDFEKRFYETDNSDIR